MSPSITVLSPWDLLGQRAQVSERFSQQPGPVGKSSLLCTLFKMRTLLGRCINGSKQLSKIGVLPLKYSNSTRCSAFSYMQQLVLTFGRDIWTWPTPLDSWKFHCGGRLPNFCVLYSTIWPNVSFKGVQDVCYFLTCLRVQFMGNHTPTRPVQIVKIQTSAPSPTKP